MNADAPSLSLVEAKGRVLGIQTKLHRWATAHRGLTQRQGLVESRMLGNGHVRFGGRAEETDQPRG